MPLVLEHCALVVRGLQKLQGTVLNLHMIYDDLSAGSHLANGRRGPILVDLH